VESEQNAPRNLNNVQICLGHLVHMESEGSSKDDMGKCLEDLRCEATLLNQEVAEAMPGSTLKLLADCSKLREASIQLTRDAKMGNLDVIVWARVAAMIGLLNIYTDDNLKYSWKRASEIVAKTEGVEKTMRDTSTSGLSTS
jgi:hypothetical protein